MIASVVLVLQTVSSSRISLLLHQQSHHAVLQACCPASISVLSYFFSIFSWLKGLPLLQQVILRACCPASSGEQHAIPNVLKSVTDTPSSKPLGLYGLLTGTPVFDMPTVLQAVRCHMTVVYIRGRNLLYNIGHKMQPVFTTGVYFLTLPCKPCGLCATHLACEGG